MGNGSRLSVCRCFVRNEKFGLEIKKALSRVLGRLFFGAAQGTRTLDLRITNALLYQLS